MSAADAAIADTVAMVKRVISRVKTAEEFIDEQEKQIEVLQKQNETLSKRLSEHTTAVTEAKRKLSQTEEQLKDAAQREQAAKALQDAATDAMEKLRAEREKLRAENTALRLDVEQHTARQAQMTQQLASVTATATTDAALSAAGLSATSTAAVPADNALAVERQPAAVENPIEHALYGSGATGERDTSSATATRASDAEAAVVALRSALAARDAQLRAAEELLTQHEAEVVRLGKLAGDESARAQTAEARAAALQLEVDELKRRLEFIPTSPGKQSAFAVVATRSPTITRSPEPTRASPSQGSASTPDLQSQLEASIAARRALEAELATVKQQLVFAASLLTRDASGAAPAPPPVAVSVAESQAGKTINIPTS